MGRMGRPPETTTYDLVYTCETIVVRNHEDVVQAVAQRHNQDGISWSSMARSMQEHDLPWHTATAIRVADGTRSLFLSELQPLCITLNLRLEPEWQD